MRAFHTLCPSTSLEFKDWEIEGLNPPLTRVKTLTLKQHGGYESP